MNSKAWLVLFSLGLLAYLAAIVLFEPVEYKTMRPLLYSESK